MVCRKERRRTILIAILMILFCAASVAAEELIPSELKSFAVSLQETAQGSVVRVIIGICLIGVGIGLAVTKQSAAAKTGAIAVCIGGACVMFGPQIMDKVMVINNG